MFFLKSKKIVLDCFTDDESAFTFAKPANGAKFLPDWWKSLPAPNARHDFETGTTLRNMRACPGLIDFYRRGVVFPLWSDLDLLIGPQGDPHYSYQFADHKSSLHDHSHLQYSGFADIDKYQHIKLVSPWSCYTKESIEWVCSTPFYNNPTPEKDYMNIPGMLNFKYSPGTHIQLFFKRDAQEKRVVSLDFGTPMLICHPLSEKDIEIKTHLLDSSELARIKAKVSNLKFSKNFMTTRKLFKTGEAQECPFKKKR